MIKEAFDIFKLTLTQNYVNYNGRARRREYWLFVLATFLIGLALGILIAIIPFLSFLSGLVSLALLVPTICLTIRRLHDINRCGWWYLLALTGIGSIVILVFCLTPGTVGANDYGEDPKA